MYRTPGVRTSSERQRCLYCGREQRPGEECVPCRILVPPAASAHYRATLCARCGNPNLTRLALGPNDAEVDHCLGCRGAFVSSGAWTALLDAIAAGEALDLARFGERVESPFPLVRCPVCRYEMERARFAGTSAVVIDVCNQHGTWLDRGELPALAAFLRGAPDAQASPAGTSDEEVERYIMRELVRAEITRDKALYDALHARLATLRRSRRW
ncbi:MAG: zf-TFIIB domain-containing protein [Labilithrix sp.]|nr:zf-TFIIB domain-containing protein [Labilithrix sp.]MCW5809924.1 zf-TFIIB domain-containing protein [Labilithrix sp.]